MAHRTYLYLNSSIGNGFERRGTGSGKARCLAMQGARPLRERLARRLGVLTRCTESSKHEDVHQAAVGRDILVLMPGAQAGRRDSVAAPIIYIYI